MFFFLILFLGSLGWPLHLCAWPSFADKDKSRLSNQLATVAVDLPSCSQDRRESVCLRGRRWDWWLCMVMAMAAMTRSPSSRVRVHGLCNTQLALSLLPSTLGNYGALTWPMNVCRGCRSHLHQPYNFDLDFDRLMVGRGWRLIWISTLIQSLFVFVFFDSYESPCKNALTSKKKTEQKKLM